MRKNIAFLLKGLFVLLAISLSACEMPEENSRSRKKSSNPDYNNSSFVDYSGLSSRDPSVLTHVVTFNSNGGSPVPSQTIEHSYKASKPETPTRAGYEFVNWTYQGEEWSFIGYSVTEDMTLEANWRILTYSISYEVDDGYNASENVFSYTVEDEITLYPAEKYGYTFISWLLNDEPVDKINKGTTGDLVLTASFSVNTHEVVVTSANNNMGTVSGGRTCAYSAPVTVTATPNSGYSFAGWYKNGSRVSTNATYTFYMPDSSVSLEARWNVISYTITYSLYGGSNATENPYSYTVEDEFNLYEPYKTGYTFISWELDGQPIDKIEVGTTGNITLVAVFAVNTHDVLATSSDETRGTVTGSGTYNYSSQVTVVATPKPGYDFAGWYKNGSLTSSNKTYTFSMPDASVSLEARWKIINYTISYSLNGGSNSSNNATKYTVEDEINLYPATKRGYTFVTWKYNGQPIDKINLGTTGNISLTAEFVINSYDVLATSQNDARGTVTGSGSYEYGSQVTVTATPNNGYSFAGWYQNNRRVSTNQKYTFSMSDQETTLQARWNVLSYSISYNLNGGTNDVSNPSNYTVEDEIALKDPTRFGFTFSGWVLNGNLVDRIDLGTIGDLSLEASWEVISGYENIEDFIYDVTDGGIVIKGLANKNKTNVVIPRCATSIQACAFSSCSNLVSVVVPDTVTFIGVGAFQYCSSLKSLTVPFIGKAPDNPGSLNYMFNKVPQSLEEVIISDSCTTLDGDAFYGCSSIKSIRIGSGLTSLTSDYGLNPSFRNLFYDCTSLESIYISGDNPLYASSQGILYNKNKTKILLVPKGYQGEVVIPDTITSIENDTFSDCVNITSVIIPSSVTYIGYSAFFNCPSLTSIVISNSETSFGDLPFPGTRCCVGVERVNGNYTIVDIAHEDENSASLYNEFGGGYYLGNDDNPYMILVKTDYETIEECVVNSNCRIILNSAFYYCKQLRTVTIPESVVCIDDDAFGYYPSIQEINYHGTLESWLNLRGKAYLRGDVHLFLDGDDTETTQITLGNDVRIIEDRAFSMCSSLTDVTLGENTVLIGQGSFRNCSSLKNVTIPDGLLSIGLGAFYGCSSLTSFVVPNSVVEINNNAFAYCTSLSSVILPESLSLIEGNVFDHCSSLESITIPDTVTGIGHQAFSYCTSLQAIYVPEGVKLIENDAFDFCTSLESVSIPNSLVSLGTSAFSNCDLPYNRYDNANYIGNESNPYLVLMYADYGIETCVVNNNCKFINSSAFLNHTNLTSVTIPDGVISIGSSAFKGCTALRSIVIPDSVETISYNTFAGCTSLESVTLSNKISQIDSDTFSGCTSLSSVSISENVSYIYKTVFNGCTSFEFNEYDNALYLGNEQNPYLCLIKAKSTDITSCVINSNCRRILNEAFLDCTLLESITIPEGVISMGTSAFYNCQSLQSVTLPDGFTYIGNSAFVNCVNLSSITIPDSVTFIGHYAFDGCSSLQSVTIPNGVTYVGSSPFVNCDSLQFNEYDNALYLGNDQNPYFLLFKAKDKTITSCDINENCKYIASCAFEGCTDLTSIVIPEGVISIGGRCFEYCSSLQSVSIPDSVEYIGYMLFYNCYSLKSVVILGSIAQYETDLFEYDSPSIVVYFNGTQYEWYSMNIDIANWNISSAVVCYYYSESQPIEEGYYWHYVNGVPTIW